MSTCCCGNVLSLETYFIFRGLARGSYGGSGAYDYGAYEDAYEESYAEDDGYNDYGGQVNAPFAAVFVFKQWWFFKNCLLLF